MGKFVKHERCDDCGSSDGKAVYVDGSTFCFVCNRSNRGNRVERTKSGTEIAELPMAALVARGIPANVSEMYGVRVEYSPETREEVAYYFPRTKNGVVTGYQKRTLPKEFTSIGDTKDCELFGQSICGDGGKLLIITEGNEDCLAAKAMLLSLGKNYRVVSMPNGANVRALKNNVEWVEQFENVVLCFDQDKPGREAAKAVSDILSPGKVRIMTMPDKDANEMLVLGKAEEFLRALNKAAVVKPDEIVDIEEIYNEAIQPINRGLDWPWPTLTKVTYGRRRKEMYGFGAGTGAGKTEAFKEVIQHVVEVDNLPVGVFFLEEHPALTAKIIAGKVANKRFHVPDSGWTREELEEGIAKLRGKVYLYNHFGQKDWGAIKSKIRYMVVTYGVKDIFLDHLTALVADATDVNKELERVMADMAAMTQELDFTLYFISHLATPEGKSHEEGGRVTVSQFRGSRTIGFWSHYLFGLERNQQAEDERVRNTVWFRVLKDRYTGEATGTVFPLVYRKDTGRFLEGEVNEFEF